MTAELEDCPVCDTENSLKRVVPMSASGQTINVSEADTICFNPHTQRLCIHQ